MKRIAKRGGTLPDLCRDIGATFFDVARTLERTGRRIRNDLERRLPGILPADPGTFRQPRRKRRIRQTVEVLEQA